MKLTDKHIKFENNCRLMFEGQTILGVVYGEIKYFADEEGNNIRPEPFYKTKYPDIDTLDYSIYFKTADKTIWTFWDSTFICYGLLSKQIDLSETFNSHEQKWDVSNESKWQNLIGQKIRTFKILWEETQTSNLDGSNKFNTTYPQTFEILAENGETIIISASEFKQENQSQIYPLSDNLLVTTKKDIARKLKLIA